MQDFVDESELWKAPTVNSWSRALVKLSDGGQVELLSERLAAVSVRYSGSLENLSNR
jgi:hypothetical protein